MKLTAYSAAILATIAMFIGHAQAVSIGAAVAANVDNNK